MRACVRACMLMTHKCRIVEMLFFVGALWWWWWWIKFMVAFPSRCVDVEFCVNESFRGWVLFLCYCGFLLLIILPHLISRGSTAHHHTMAVDSISFSDFNTEQTKIAHCDVICSINSAAILVFLLFLLLFYTHTRLFIRHLSSKCSDRVQQTKRFGVIIWFCRCTYDNRLWPFHPK